MKAMFVSLDLWELVENGYTVYEGEGITVAQMKEMKENNKKDAKALSYIQQGLDDTIFSSIMGTKTSKESWELLRNEYEGSKQVITLKLQTLRRDFETLLMKSSETIHDFSIRVLLLIKQSLLVKTCLIKKLLKKF